MGTRNQAVALQRGTAYYASFLRECKDINAGRIAHSHILKEGLNKDVFLANLLIHMYGQNGDLMEAEELFNQMLHRDHFTWNNMMNAYLAHGFTLDTQLLFLNMAHQKQGVAPNKCSFVIALSACTKENAVFHAHVIHTLALFYGFDDDIRVGTALLEFFRKHGSLEEMQKTFYAILEQDVFSWTTMITSFSKRGQGHSAFLLFERMQLESVLPDKAIFSSTLSSFDSVNLLVEGKRLHACICGSGYQEDAVIGTALINMYGNCGNLEAAQSTFALIQKRDTISWNAMLAVCIKHGFVNDALQLYDEMLQKEVQIDTATFVTLLDCLSDQSHLVKGKKIHDHIIAMGFELDLLVGTSLLNMYARCGCLVHAKAVFDKMSNCDVVLWNALIDAYYQHDEGKEALDLFQQMQQSDVVPDKFTFSSAIQACACEMALQDGKLLHNKIIINGWESDVVLGTSLVTMYGQCSSLEDVTNVFGGLAERNLVSWNAMIGVGISQGQVSLAIDLFEQMQQMAEMPNQVTYVSILSAYDNKASLMEGKFMHARVCHDVLTSNTNIGNAIISMYSRCGGLEDAEAVFDEIPERDVITWTIMISLYVQYGLFEHSRLLFQQMQKSGVILDKAFVTILIYGYATPAALDEGKAIHSYIKKTDLSLDVDIANAFINMYQRCGSLHDALKTFYELAMKDKHTFTNVLSVCANLVSLSDGKLIHHHITEHEVEVDSCIGNALVNMYGKCGSVEDAHIVFYKMPGRDTVSWSTMIASYAQHGQGEDALALLDQMHYGGFSPTGGTLLGILSGCIHAGLVEDGFKHFVLMHEEYGLTPSDDHYNCVIGLLTRSGRLEEAEDTILQIPYKERCSPWLSLLGACARCGDVERGERAAKCAMEIDPTNSMPYVLLANLYASMDRKDDATRLLTCMQERGLMMPRSDVQERFLDA